MRQSILLFLVTLAMILYPLPTYAVTMSNDNYMLQNTQINPFSDITSQHIDMTIVQPKQKTQQYSIEQGFAYETQGLLFSIYLSPLTIDYGTLTPTNPIVRTSQISIINGSASLYSVYIYENHPLSLNQSMTSIPDTTCDNGTCSETNSDSWDNILTYGFGYRCNDIIGNGCIPDFSNATNFKQFADISKAKIPQPIINTVLPKTDTQASVIYKVNIDKAQPSGVYKNSITYLALPHF